MVQPPSVVRLHSVSIDQFGDPVGKVWEARGGVLFLKQRSWKTIKIMNGTGGIHGSDLRPLGFPVGRNAQDRLWLRDVHSSRYPGGGAFIVFDGIHWAAVPNKQDRHF